MKRLIKSLSSLLLLILLAAPTLAQEDKSLPRVLVIGDSVYSQHARELGKALEGKVHVVFAAWNPDEIADSTTTIALLNRHLGRIDRNGKPVAKEDWPTWDLIHFNCGLADLIHRAPGMKQFRVMPIYAGGVRNTSLEQYTKNIETLVMELKSKAPKAKLVWASTTPIRASSSKVFEQGSEIIYNAAAAKVMTKHDVATNDMYNFVKSLINMDRPASHGADPFHFDKKPIHMPIVRVIENAFSLQPMPKTEEEISVAKDWAISLPVGGN